MAVLTSRSEGCCQRRFPVWFCLSGFTQAALICWWRLLGSQPEEVSWHKLAAHSNWEFGAKEQISLSTTMTLLQKHILVSLTMFPELCSFSDSTPTFYFWFQLLLEVFVCTYIYVTAVLHMYLRAFCANVDQNENDADGGMMMTEACGFPTAWPSCYMSHLLVTLSRTEWHAFNQLSSVVSSSREDHNTA